MRKRRAKSSSHALRALLDMYSPRFIIEVVYMLQASEYQLLPYFKWFWRTRDVGRVMHRRKLEPTKVSAALVAFVVLLILAQLKLALICLTQWANGNGDGLQFIALAILVALPVMTAHLIMIPVQLGRWLIINPITLLRRRAAEQIFANHPGKLIAIAGSYGKTTMKEILFAVLDQDRVVAATKGNMNTEIAHIRFAGRLNGREHALIVELGEYVPGDIKHFCQMLHPKIGIITGLAPAHLHNFGTIDAAGLNLFDLADYLNDTNVYVNDENVAMKKFLKKDYKLFSRTAVNGWTISQLKTDLEGMSFNLRKGKKTLKLKCGLIGMHNAGPIALAAVLAMQEFDIPAKHVEAAVAKLKPYEHRFAPTKLANGAWLIDDTYNGNIEGVRAAVDFLKEIKAKRKIYVTPGLVEQGVETVSVHNELGELLADAVDEVVLMRNSTTPLIEAGLTNGKFEGIIRRIDDPLKFYDNVQYLVSDGDVVLMQNDWTDNYA